MNDKRHHQRRRRRLNWGVVFKTITFLGQAIYYVARFWFSDRE
ncbi:DUF4426 domain-containing protein [Devosia enhydra]|nr:DUF4426 domain-containing protein [Devosia enhydra]